MLPPNPWVVVLVTIVASGAAQGEGNIRAELDTQIGAVKSGNSDGGNSVTWLAGTVLALRATYDGLSGTLALPIGAILKGGLYDIGGRSSEASFSLANLSVDTAYTWKLRCMELRAGAGLSLPTAQNRLANSLYAGYRFSDFGLFNPGTTTIRGRLGARQVWPRFSLEATLGMDEHHLRIHDEITMPPEKVWRTVLRGGVAIGFRLADHGTLTVSYTAFVPLGDWDIGYDNLLLGPVTYSPLEPANAVELGYRVELGRSTIDVRLYVPLVFGYRDGSWDDVTARYPGPGVNVTTTF